MTQLMQRFSSRQQAARPRTGQIPELQPDRRSRSRDTIDAQRPIHARLPAQHLEARVDQLARVGVVNAHRDLTVARSGQEPLVDSERADGRRHVAAVCAVVDGRPVHRDLRERVVDVRVGAGR
jgi:hypothetical protein